MQFWPLYFLLMLTLGCARPDYIKAEENISESTQKPTSECHYKLPRKNLCFEVLWNSAPTSNNYAEFEISFSEPVDGELLVKLWMPSMGHGSAPVTLIPISRKLFTISRVYFIMPGEWEIRISLRNSQGELEDQFNLPVLVP